MNAKQRGMLTLLLAGMLLIWGGLAAVFLWPRPEVALPGGLPTQAIIDTGTAPWVPSPTWPPLWTPTSTSTVTATPTITLTPTPRPTRTPMRTRTPTPVPPPPPTDTPLVRKECECTGDIYSCSDFPTQAAAQACYEYCKIPGYGDLHRLDIDGNGRACD